LAKADHVPVGEFDIGLFGEKFFVQKSTMGASKIIDKEFSSVFMLQNCMSARDCWILTCDIYDVWLPTKHEIGLGLEVQCLQDLPFLHYLKVKFAKRFGGPKGLYVIGKTCHFIMYNLK
jgi:hypothetical protein